MVLTDAEAVAGAAAERVVSALRRGARTLVLAGGTTPQRSYQLLGESALEWGRVTVLFGDERCVGPHSAESNFRMAKETLLDRVAPGTVHRIPGELGADEAAALYEPIVASLQPLDLVLLGIGPDGHTASLFPGHDALSANTFVTGVHGAPKPPPDRVSLTLRTLRSARQVLFLVTGADKAEAVARAAAGEVPAGMIPRAEWLVDGAAARQLARTSR